jgi:membrane-associated phospholipid phosphatase
MHSSCLPRERPKWYLEVVALAGGYFLFGLARAAIDRGNPVATSNAALVQRLERVLHLAVEYPVNHAILSHPFAIYLTGYFYRLCLIAVPAILVWLYVSRPTRYRQLRSVLVLVTLLDLPLVWLYPEAPPRFALNGVVDYMATYDILYGAASREPGAGVNLLAAMPSTHIAWTTWCAYAVWSVLRPQHPRAAWLAWLCPLLTAFVVLATGHHYVLDILAGVAVVAVAIQRQTPSPRRCATRGRFGRTPLAALRPGRHLREIDRRSSERPTRSIDSAASVVVPSSSTRLCWRTSIGLRHPRHLHRLPQLRLCKHGVTVLIGEANQQVHSGVGRRNHLPLCAAWASAATAARQLPGRYPARPCQGQRRL